MNEKDNKMRYEKFKERLNLYKKNKKIKILKRGFSKEYAYNKFRFETANPSLQDFADKLFYFGEKSSYHKEQSNERNFKINQIDDEIFEYIFDKTKEIITTQKYKGTQHYIKKNKKLFEYFKDERNKKDFVRNISSLKDRKDKFQLRNYYFRTMHQLCETSFKEESPHVSGTEDPEVAKVFGKEGIVISFWDFDFNNFQSPNQSIPIFKGKPYSKQKEISVFGAIFPHFIYSIYGDNKCIRNPAIFSDQDIDDMITMGFRIDQRGFEDRLLIETTYGIGISEQNSEYETIDPKSKLIS